VACNILNVTVLTVVSKCQHRHLGKCTVVMVYFFLLQITNCATPREFNQTIMRDITIPHVPSFPTVAGKEHEGCDVSQKVSSLT
jgi:hypothetical protein